MGLVLASNGDSKGALARFQECLVFTQRIAAANPSAEFNRGVGSVRTCMGRMFQRRGNHAEASEHLTEGLRIVAKASIQDPGSLLIQSTLATAHEDMADHLASADDLTKAESHYEQSLAIRRKIADGDQQSAEARRELRDTLGKFGALRVRMAREPGKSPEEQAALWQEARELLVFANVQQNALINELKVTTPEEEAGRLIAADLAACDVALSR